MSIKSKLLSAAGIIFIVIQFIRPAHNLNGTKATNDISIVANVPDSVQAILRNACYDCHSNNTYYPWYSNIQPAGWLMANHILKGKKEINFSEFGSYSQRRQLTKMNEIAEAITEDIMPLASYRLMHEKAKLNASEKRLLITWVQQSAESLQLKNEINNK
jgi:hypothetical protein